MMKTIGMIGGVSWESSIEYYRILNETVKERLGGLHSAKCLMNSVEFQTVVDLMEADNWDELSDFMQETAMVLKAGGADFLIICSNTLSQFAPDIQNNVGIPVLSIADSVARKIQSMGIHKAGFIGTRYSMEGDYYRDTLQKYGIEYIIPEAGEREIINRIIFEELCLGVINQASKESFINIINKLHTKGAEGIILGCTEIPLLIKQEDVCLPVFDTLAIHADDAVELMLI